jgi:3-carboxy-cis,cis-muconate cycloisomerase
MTGTHPSMHTPLLSAAAIENRFSSHAVWQSWLDVEAALALTQAELGMIPPDAAEEIARRASLDSIDVAALEADIARTRAPILSLVRALASVCRGDAGGYVHWGATTQNIIQTGLILIMRQVHAALMQRLAVVLERLAELGESHAETVMAGRTNNRHALPITFGFKVAGWIEEVLRHEERLRQAEPRVLVVLCGGAVGAMHAFGDNGPELNRRLAARLGLGSAAVPSRAALDHLCEYVLLLAMLGTTCGKIARQLYGAMANEVDEVAEGLDDDVVGSSTMPQKVNSKVAVKVISLAAKLRAQVPLALEAMQPSNEGDVAHGEMMNEVIDTACPTAYQLLSRMDELIEIISVDPGRMRRNLDSSGELIAAESAMMALADALGRTAAHEIVHEAARKAASSGTGLLDILWDDTRVRNAISRTALARALSAHSYTGQSSQLARQMSVAARAASESLRGRYPRWTEQATEGADVVDGRSIGAEAQHPGDHSASQVARSVTEPRIRPRTQASSRRPSAT